MSRPVWVGVAILMEDGTTDTWQMNANDGHVQIRTEQEGLLFRGPVPPLDVLANMLVPTRLYISGKARRWGPDAGHGSRFTIPERLKEIEA